VKKELLDKIRKRHAVVGVIGLGYVGLPLALRFAEAGFPVLGFDVDKAKIQRLAEGQSYIEHIAAERIAAGVSKGFAVTHDFSRASEPDALIICDWNDRGDRQALEARPDHFP
jgi:UDP-N-acetyl-D-glucosamine dehydrogenase